LGYGGSDEERGPEREPLCDAPKPPVPDDL
jgi:hypothetical protein